MTPIHVHVDVPMMTKARFIELTGINESTLNDKIFKGEIPIIKTNLQTAKRGAVYINMIELAKMAASSGFQHPKLNSNPSRLNRK